MVSSLPGFPPPVLRQPTSAPRLHGPGQQLTQPEKKPRPASVAVRTLTGIPDPANKPFIRSAHVVGPRPATVEKNTGPTAGVLRTLPGFPAPAPRKPSANRRLEGPFPRPVENKRGSPGRLSRGKNFPTRGRAGRPLTQVAVLSAAVIPFGGILMLVGGPGPGPTVQSPATAPQKEIISFEPIRVAPSSWTLGQAVSQVGPLLATQVDPAQSVSAVTASPGPSALSPGAQEGPVSGPTGGAMATKPNQAVSAKSPSNKPAGSPSPNPGGPVLAKAGSAPGPPSGTPPSPALGQAASSEDAVATLLTGAEKVGRLVSKELDTASASLKDPRSLILYVWGSEGPKALVVAICESNLRVWARNPAGPGYEGIFQLGPIERAQYGAGDDARSQVEAAHRLFLVRGWEPWPVCARGFM